MSDRHIEAPDHTHSFSLTEDGPDVILHPCDICDKPALEQLVDEGWTVIDDDGPVPS